MVEVKSFSAPMLELSVTHDGNESIVKVFGVLEIDDYLIGSLEGIVNRCGFSRGLHDWIYLNSLQLISVSAVDCVTWVAIESVDHFCLERKQVGKCCDDPQTTDVKREVLRTGKRPTYRYFVKENALSKWIKLKFLAQYEAH